MIPVWVDTNVLLRFLLDEPQDQAKRARTLINKAERAEIALIVPVVVLAEVVWVLHSYYGQTVVSIAEKLRPLVATEGLVVENSDVVLEALRVMAERSLKFADAYLVAAATSRQQAVATFDLELRKLSPRAFPV